MPGSRFFLLGLVSCAMYAVFFYTGYALTDTGSSWNTFWNILLILTGACAAMTLLWYVVCRVQEHYSPGSTDMFR